MMRALKDEHTGLSCHVPLACNSSELSDRPCHSTGALEGISGRRSETRVSPLKQPLGLHNPGCGFVFTAEAGDRPELTPCCCAAWPIPARRFLGFIGGQLVGG